MATMPVSNFKAAADNSCIVCKMWLDTKMNVDALCHWIGIDLTLGHALSPTSQLLVEFGVGLTTAAVWLALFS